MKIGKQYDKDDDFKREARLHQSKYRGNVLCVNCDEFGNMLEEQDGRDGLNFYSDFNILDAVYERYGKRYNRQLYSNLLRSEHIPFNLYIPLRENLDYAKNVFNDLLPINIKAIQRIEIEYAPHPKEKYLDDHTSFDTFIEYNHLDGSIGILGIEVKYTEQGYPLKIKSTEEKQLRNKSSKYWIITEKSGLFKTGIEDKLVQDDYRQIWRNHILGESIVQVDGIKHFTSITMYPDGNTHFRKSISEYNEFLTDKDRVLGITYEEYLCTLLEYSPGRRFRDWIDYLRLRYNIKPK